jgi:photosystem II stability/assembly factor-like uncharacterized protein
MKLPLNFSVLAALTMLFALHAGAQGRTVNPQPTPPGTSSPRQLTPEQIAKMPVRALPVKDFKLLNPSTGWVSTGNRLLFTTDNGAHWKDISPSNPNQDRYSDVFFLDADTGWVLLSGHPREGECGVGDRSESDWAFHVASTVDGGKTWNETHIKMPSCDLGSFGPSLNDNGNLTFADKHHGWLILEHESGSAFSFGSLFATSDGGRTWHKSNDNPGFYGDIRAFPNGDVWAVDGNNVKLAVSHKGGNGFENVSLSNPKEYGPDRQPLYALPVFEDTLHGYVAGTYRRINGTKSTAVLFETGDGGRTWKPDRMLSNLVQGETVATTVADSTWILPFAPQGSLPTLVKLRPNDRITAPDHKKSGDFRSCKLSLSTQDEGWMNCSGKLSSTVDGGSTWTEIAPRTRNGVLTTDPVTLLPTPTLLKTIKIKPATGKSGAAAVVPRDTSSGHVGYASGIDQHLGFDKDLILSMDDMATWWASSPYYDVGIYLPGSPSGPTNAPTKKNPDLVLLDPDWVDTVVGQGWGIIPIWSGLQPPCTVEPHKHTFSAVPDEAYRQGTSQAVKAYTSAKALGFDGTIIYVDLEEYDHSVCGAAVKKYVTGWVEEMHSLGGSGSAGVYGNQDVASQDLTGADEGFITRKDKRVTVWGLNHYSGSELTDDLAWTNKQRIHQYMIDKPETWGGAGPFKIDNDIVDATVVQSSGTKKLPDTMAYELVSNGSNESWLNGIANGINNSGFQDGEAAGGYFPSDNDPWAGGFTYLSGETTATQLYLGAIETYTMGINNLGEIVGSYIIFDGDGNPISNGIHAKSGAAALKRMNYPGAAHTVLTGINDAGWIVGMYSDNDFCDNQLLFGCNSHCALWKPDAKGTYSNPTTFDAPGQTSTTCNGINGMGQIVGSYMNSDWSLSTPFLDDAESGDPSAPANFSTINGPDVGGTPGDYGGLSPSGINNNGQIVGNDDSSGLSFLVNSFEFDEFAGPVNSLPFYLYGINDDAQMVGIAYPQPDPSDPGQPVGLSSGIIVNALPTQP